MEIIKKIIKKITRKKPAYQEVNTNRGIDTNSMPKLILYLFALFIE
jgi:hypothetical protein